MLGIGAIDLDWSGPFAIFINGPQSNINVVSTPVRELAAGILIPPTEVVVTSLLDIVHQRSLTEPHVPVEVSRWVRLFERSADIASTNPDGHLCDLAKKSPAHQIDGSQETILITALLSPHEEDAITVFAARISNQLILFESQSQRLLTEDMFASLQSFDGDFDVPVIRSHNTHDIDISTLQNFAIVGTKPNLVRSTVTQTSLSLGGFHELGRYRVMVRANLSSGGSTAFSAGHLFRVDSPILLTPLAEVQVTSRPVLFWNTVPTAVRYEFQIEDILRLKYFVASSSSSTSTSLTFPNPLPMGMYDVRVRAIDALNEKTSWSPARSFTVVPVPSPSPSVWN